MATGTEDDRSRSRLTEREPLLGSRTGTRRASRQGSGTGSDIVLVQAHEPQDLPPSPSPSQLQPTPTGPEYVPDPVTGPGGEVEVEIEVGLQPDPSLTRVDKTSSRWQLFWKILIGLLCLGIIVLFIKGFVEEGGGGFEWGKTFKKALGGGLSGAAAMVLQVLTLMPLRTIMNYQYRFGTTTTEATKTLYADGGFRRYYMGLGAALIQGPVSRFGDTFANVGALALLSSNPYTRKLPTFIQSAFGSAMAALFRIVLTPVDTVKTTLQTRGKEGWGILRRRIKTNGIGSMWYGALATAAATFVGHYPWFGTYNVLQTSLPLPSPDGPHHIALTLLRQAFIGFCASVVSDSISNSLRVVKTYRQVEERDVSYSEAARTIIATEGLRGLMGRGLKTRILTNGLQGLLFSVLWKLFMDLWDKETRS